LDIERIGAAVEGSVSNRHLHQQPILSPPAEQATRTHAAAGSWPRLMRAETASRLRGRNVGASFPPSCWYSVAVTDQRPGQRQKWDREDLDAAVARMKGEPMQIFDAATVLGDAS
jgi:hypothetical protein